MLFGDMPAEVNFQGSREKLSIAMWMQSLLHVSARGNERGCRYHIGKRHTSIPAALRAVIAAIPREPISVGTIRSLDECKNKHPEGPAS